jgi:phospholipase/carboxylesterase
LAAKMPQANAFESYAFIAIFARRIIFMGRALFIALYLFSFIGNVAGQVPVLETSLALKYIVHAPAKPTRGPVVILLHGYGSDEKDLYGLRSAFPPNAIIISAQAPYALAGGGYQWYEMENINGQRDGKKEELERSVGLVNKFITQVVEKYNANPKDVYLMGFSQGAIMSFAVGLAAPDKVKGIGVLSGMLYPSVRATIKSSPALKKLKIFIAHGTTDERIPFKYAVSANSYLATMGLKPEFHQYEGMGHSISNSEMADLIKWLK